MLSVNRYNEGQETEKKEHIIGSNASIIDVHSFFFFLIFFFVGDNAFQRFQNLVVGGLHGFYFVDEDHIPCFKLSCSGPSPYNLISGLYVTKCPCVSLLITYFHFKLYFFFS